MRRRKEAFRKLHDWLVLDHNDSAIAMAGFILKNTLSDNGCVTRGVCKVAEGHTHITDVGETSNIVKTVEDGVIGAEADGVKLDPESYVSMMSIPGGFTPLPHKNIQRVKCGEGYQRIL